MAGALIEAHTRGCTQAVLIVHEFLSEPDPRRDIQGTRRAFVERNAAAFACVVRALTADPNAEVRGGKLLGPVTVPGDARVPDLPPLLGKGKRRVSYSKSDPSEHG